LIAGCVQQAETPTELEEVTISGYFGDTGMLVYLAEEQGFFEDYGLNVTINDFESGKQATDALIMGQADVSTATEVVFVSNTFDHYNLRIFGTIALARTNELIARRDKGISNISDLAGKKIGVTKKSSGEFFLEVFLVMNGLSVSDVEVVDLVPSEIVNSLINGSIDAGFTWEPNIYNVVSVFGDNAVTWPGQSGQDFYFVLITTEGWISENPHVAELLVRALLDAENYIEQNGDDAKEFVRTKFGLEQDYINAVWDKHDFIVVLPQALIVAMEDQARWRISEGLTNATMIPNYLNYIYLDALEEVRPESVGIIR
jgi:NitT/TauT family transport system substrate-binding protein